MIPPSVGSGSGGDSSGGGCLAGDSLGITLNVPSVPCCNCFSAACRMIQNRGFLFIQLHIPQGSVGAVITFIPTETDELWSASEVPSTIVLVPGITAVVPSMLGRRLTIMEFSTSQKITSSLLPSLGSS